MPRKYNTRKKLHVKKGDEVLVLAGNDKGQRGKVIMVFPAKERVLVEGINMRTFHEKRTQENPQACRLKREESIHITNVKVIEQTTNEAQRIGRTCIDECVIMIGGW